MRKVDGIYVALDFKMTGLKLGHEDPLDYVWNNDFFGLWGD